MRQRITFLHKPQDGVDPSTFKVTDSSIEGPILPSVREDRLTLALDELPLELRQFLEACHELHIRWVTPYPYETVSPLLSRLSPGFHLFYTPASHKLPSDQPCATLKAAFGPMDCNTADTSFTTLPNDRFSHSTAYQYYQPLASLHHLITYAQTTLCPAPSPADPPDASCAARTARLATASTLDLSYDTISHALQITATWPHSAQALAVTAPATDPPHRIEVGILTAAGAAAHPSLEPHEIGMAGALTVLGQDAKKPSGTIFSFAARHRRVAHGAAFTARFAAPAGLHPTLRLELNAAAVVPPAGGRADDDDDDDGAECALHAYLPLPRGVFADRYQLADELFLASKNLSALRYTSQPVDLEAPEYVMAAWGSAVLLELAPAATATAAEVPLHLRYLAPAAGGYAAVDVPYPAVFWACTADEGTKFPTSPFERVNLGYDGLFGPRTVFWHVEPQPAAALDGRLVSSVRVPVLDADRAGWVSAGTAAAVVLGFGWIVWKLLTVYLATGYGPTKQMEGLEEEEKTKKKKL